MSEDKRETEFLLRAWEKTVDVQQHFNNIELRIRSLAVTGLGAFLGASGFALRDKLSVSIDHKEISVVFFLLLAGLVLWFAFLFMDYSWYHKLLIGSVKEGERLERQLDKLGADIRLTRSISENSPIRLHNCEMHSKHKFWVFYGLGALILSGGIVLSFFGL